jgi:uncharacterized protein (TIGR02271 family)
MSATGGPERPGDHHVPYEAIETIPVIREEARVGHRVVERGSLRVVTTVDERIERVDAPIFTEDAIIERIPMNVPVAADDLPRVREEGDTLIVPVLDEEIVVQRRYVLREEIRVKRERRMHPRTQDVLLQGQRVVVERYDAAGRPIVADGDDTPPPERDPER